MCVCERERERERESERGRAEKINKSIKTALESVTKFHQFTHSFIGINF